MGDWETDTTKTTTTRIIKEGVIHDQGFFKHVTGDTYNGEFEARKKDKCFEMRGLGVYTTAEGDTYTGVWEADKLGYEEDVSIAYTDGSKYEGSFKDYAYNGQGSYTYPDGSVLQAEFSQNTPVGQLTLVDPNGHRWLGTAEKGYGWLEPVNHYYHNLESVPKKKRRRSKASANIPT